MKLNLIFHGRFPSEKAAALFAAKEAESFAALGIAARLIVPRRLGRSRQPAHDYYGLKNHFELIYLPTLDLFRVPIIKRWAWPISFVAFTLSALLYLWWQRSGKEIVFTNESLPALVLTYFFPNVFYILHDFPERKLPYYQKLFSRARGLVVHNRWKLAQLKTRFAVDDGRVMYQPNAVDIDDFDIPLTKAEARERLGLPADKFIAVYTGHLYGWKGVEVLAEAAQMLKGEVAVCFVGGTERDVARFRNQYQSANISVLGHRQHHEIPWWQKAADVLVLPNTAKEAISKFYTSPMKLFEYLASGRPIIASRLPSVTEIVTDQTALLVEPDNPAALRDAIMQIKQHPGLGQALANRARQDVERFSWRARAKAIFAFMSQNVIK